MPTRQLRDETPPTAPPVARAASREPVLLGDVLFQTLAEIARRAPDGPEPEPRLPAQRTRPHP
ncbi:hypothetical protein [Kitasatospora aureofaciens]|uniref:hypothetical protein n=1 Tax=Kitasatospora aureofaciens TaxID=1894 RepID=UPI0038264471